MNEEAPVTPLTIDRIAGMKEKGEKIAMLTCYDASFARAMDLAGVDIVLVGDSLGMVVQGHATTVGVTLDDMAYHLQCVSRGLQRAFLLADMPFGSYYDETVAMDNAIALMQAGGSMVKLEGGGPMIDVVAYLSSRGVPVCGHLGLTPQSVHSLSGFKVQARDEAAAELLLEEAGALERAGARLLVLECVPATLGERVSRQLAIPVIGIGAGAGCDGQVLVMHDMLGLGARQPRFVANFLQDASSLEQAFAAYVSAVRDGRFPTAEHSF